MLKKSQTRHTGWTGFPSSLSRGQALRGNDDQLLLPTFSAGYSISIEIENHPLSKNREKFLQFLLEAKKDLIFEISEG